MNLQKFITESLISIQHGVEDANKKLVSKNNTPPFLIGFSSNNKEEVSISFDVAVTINEDVGGSTGGSINVIGLKLGAELETKGEHGSISRVSFKVHPNYAIG